MLSSIKAFHCRMLGTRTPVLQFPVICISLLLFYEFSRPWNSLPAIIFLLAQHFRVDLDSILLLGLCWFFFYFLVSVLTTITLEVALVFAAIPSMGLCLPTGLPIDDLPRFFLLDDIHREG